MKLTERDIRECMDYEARWCALPRTVAEEKQVVSLLESIQDHHIVVPGWTIPADVRTLMEAAQSRQGGGAPRVAGDWRPKTSAAGVPTVSVASGKTDAAEAQDDVHARMAAAFRGSPGPTPRVLTEDRRAQDVTSLSETERLEPYLRLAGAEPVLREGNHEKMAHAFGVGR
jgi:hypothetical protein